MTADELVERLVEIDRPELPVVVGVASYGNEHQVLDAVLLVGRVVLVVSPLRVVSPTPTEEPA